MVQGRIAYPILLIAERLCARQLILQHSQLMFVYLYPSRFHCVGWAVGVANRVDAVSVLPHGDDTMSCHI